ncbi:hypothetical protein BH23CHL2_BH23CHL2_16400 [soil metagenome]
MLRFSTRLTRLLGIGLLSATLLVSASTTLASPTRPTEHGPCRIGSGEVPDKCTHYKLQEAKRIGKNGVGICDTPSVLLRNGVDLYWTCRT